MKVKSREELCDFIVRAGFLPFLNAGAEGFSAEDVIEKRCWYNPLDETNPWNWRYFVAGDRRIIYGKFFKKKLGFIGRKWFPHFAAVRRDGYDFEGLYRAGYASQRMKVIMTLLKDGEMSSKEIMRRSGLKKSVMESALTKLTMKTYIVISGFEEKISKYGEPYGWPLAKYAIAEHVLKKDFTESQKESWYLIMDHLKKTFPGASEEALQKIILK